MSKWINKELFEDFVTEKMNEETTGKKSRRSDVVWATPVMGTQDKPKIYEGRFLPDKKGSFYKKFHYHGFKSGERWVFPLCPKTYDFYNFCAFCNATQKLYLGTEADKKAAYNYKRKDKFVGNFYVVDDPRDEDKKPEDKVSKTLKLYEFPEKVESKLKSMMTDKKHGLGPAIFDPGDEGYNFLIKVKATKPTPEGKQWPDYSDSDFARKPEALGTEKEIEELMAKTFSLEDYIETQKLTDDEIVQILQTEMLWDLVKDDWMKAKKSMPASPAAAASTPAPAASTPAPAKNAEPDVPDSLGNAKDLTDDELLKELDNL
jgi:hypothetical protein